MNRHFILFAIVFAAALSGVAKTFDVDISTGRPAASNEAYYHGETIEFRAVRGRVAVTNIEYGCVYYQTNGMDSVWWHTDGLVFHPTNDVGAASYRFFLEGRDDLGRDWHANGTIRMLPSPGFTPNAIEPPIVSLDFSTIEVANAPYYSKAETEAKIVELAPAPGDYANVSNAAVHAAITNALQDAAIAEKQDNLPYPTNAIPYAAISGKPSLATVATSGSYNDLSDKPTIPTVPTNVSSFNNDAGYLTGYTETDPTISAWAKAASKPTYTAAEVGATTPADVTAAIREQSLGGIWDAELEVWWTPRMRNGNLTYEATTNVNLNAGN